MVKGRKIKKGIPKDVGPIKERIDNFFKEQEELAVRAKRRANRAKTRKNNIRVSESGDKTKWTKKGIVSKGKGTSKRVQNTKG